MDNGVHRSIDASACSAIHKPSQPRKIRCMKIMAFETTSFPIAEGIGIFVGVVSWDLLVDGQAELLKAILIAVPCTLVWFGMRYWKDHTKNKRH